jgi:NAD+ diphosphatase
MMILKKGRKNPNQHLFVFCPHCGEQTLSTGSLKSFSCKNCSFNFYINTASAGIALIFNEKNERLVTRRRYDPAKGMLDFPGGFSEPGETIEDSLKREVKEELDLDISKLTYFSSCPNKYIYKQVTYNIIDFAFICKVKGFDKIKAQDDISDYYFIELLKIDKNQFGLDSPKMIIDQLLTSSKIADKFNFSDRP